MKNPPLIARADPALPAEGPQVVARPDGYYWVSADGSREVGPYPSAVVATEAAAADDESLVPGETLAEAEDEIGIADWIDPDTGAPAEEAVPRTELH